MDWSLLKNPPNQDLLNYTKALVRLRHEHAALRADAFQAVLQDKQRLLFGFKRWNDAGNVVLVVANLKDQDAGEFTVENAGLEDGKWRDAMHGNELEVHSGVFRDVIAASEVKIFLKQP